MRELEVKRDERGLQGDRDPGELARLAVSRDEAAWSEIFEAHFRTVFAFTRSRVFSAETAEDIAAHVFEIAFSRAETFDYRGAPIEAWLIGIARNLVRDHIKKVARRGSEAELPEGAGPPIADASPLADLRHDIASAMADLTEDQQTVLTLRFLMDRPVEETARLMGRSEDAVKTLQRRALAAMQRALPMKGYEHR